MIPPVLPAILENADFLTDELRPRLIARTASMAEILDFCAWTRRRGITHLMLRGSAEDLAHDLANSGRAFLYALPGVPTSRRAASEYRPFLDALAAGDLACARAIAALAPAAHHRDEESEDDFVHLACLQQLLLGNRERVEDLLVRYGTLVGDAVEPGLRALRSLAAGDGRALDAALRDQMRALRERCQALHAKGVMPEEEFATEGRVSIEGLAVIRLARELGCEPSHDQPLIPPLVWRTTGALPGPDDWMQT